MGRHAGTRARAPPRVRSRGVNTPFGPGRGRRRSRPSRLRQRACTTEDLPGKRGLSHVSGRPSFRSAASVQSTWPHCSPPRPSNTYRDGSGGAEVHHSSTRCCSPGNPMAVLPALPACAQAPGESVRSAPSSCRGMRSRCRHTAGGPAGALSRLGGRTGRLSSRGRSAWSTG